MLTVALALAELEGEAPTLRLAVGLAVALLHKEGVEEGVEQGVAVEEPVPLPVREAEGVGAALTLAEPLMLPVMLGLAPLLKLLVGEKEVEAHWLLLLEGVLQEEGVPL